jgi:hypothetical protein
VGQHRDESLDVGPGVLHEDVHVLGPARMAVEVNGDSTDHQELNLGGGEAFQQIFEQGDPQSRV